MMIRVIAAASLGALLLASCNNSGETAAEKSVPPVQGTTPAPTERAKDALQDAAQSTREAVRSLGEAGRAGLEVLDEKAPQIREGLNNAGERLRNAAGALIEDPKRPDLPGDSEMDANETPEALERPKP